MNIELKKIDISDSLQFNSSIIVELLRMGDTWKIDVPPIVDGTGIIQQLRTADDPIGRYTEILSDALGAHGYEYAWRTVKNRFICAASTPLNRSVILPSTSDISDIFTEYGIHRKGWAGDHYRYRGFGTIKKGALLSWCIENSHYLADGVTEIGVHTEEDHRQKGYAASNVAALCDCLLKNGITTIYYECALDNTASFRTAQKANLEYTGEVSYLCFEK